MAQRISGFRALVLLTAVVAVPSVRPARAEVDASGPWFVVTDPASFSNLGCHLDFVQSGSDLTMTGSCEPFSSRVELSGTINLVSGAIRVAGASGFQCDGSFTMEGTVAPDGSNLGGIGTCSSGFSYRISGSRCGNGVVDGSEQCDDGNRSEFDCCDAGCRFMVVGAPCDLDRCRASTCDGAGVCQRADVMGQCDDGDPCTAGDMCLNGTCVGSTLPDGSGCDDSDPCTEGDSCQFGQCIGGKPVNCGPCSVCEPFRDQGCVQRPRYDCTRGTGTVLLKDRPGVRDSVRWRWEVATSVPFEEFGDPRTSTDYALCAFDESNGEDSSNDRVLLASAVPAGGDCGHKSCWKGTTHGYAYLDPKASSGGIRSLVLHSGTKATRIEAEVGGGNLELAPLPVGLPLVVQLEAADGSCWQAAYEDAAVNNPRKFEGKASGSSGDDDDDDE